MAYKRVLLKLSGEALKENSDAILSAEALDNMAQMVKKIHESGVQVCIVIGAGNIWRGNLAEGVGIERAPADYMGMMGTVMNAVAMSSALKKAGVDSIVFTAVPAIPELCVPYNKEEAIKAMNEGKVVFLAGGTGKPFFTTDTAAALRALELDCKAILVGKNGVDGIYTDDPDTNPDAKFIKNITFLEIIKRKLKVMDLSAIELIKNSDIDVRVFSMADPENFLRVAEGEDIGTTVYKGE